MEVNVRGEGFRLTLDVVGYERERRGVDAYDDNWLSGTAALEILRPRDAMFRAKCGVAWQTTDFARFLEDLGSVLDDLTGVATFSTLEEQVEFTVRLDHGKGSVEGRIQEHAVAALEFEGETDQSFLAETLAELRAVTASFPVRR